MSNYQKNQSVELTVTDIGVNGEGIGHIDGYAFFVHGALPGDRVLAKVLKVKKHYAFAKSVNIITPSDDRAAPLCPVHMQCGGCQLQGLSYAAQLRFKETRVTQDLIRIGGIADALSLRGESCAAPAAYRYRNKALYPIRQTKGGIATGFFAEHSHRLIACEDCLLCHEKNKNILNTVIAFMNKYHISAYDEETGTGDIRHVLIKTFDSAFDSAFCILVCVIINTPSLAYEDKLIDELSKNVDIKSISISVNQRRDNVVVGETSRCIYGEPFISQTICGMDFRISALSFFQVNTAQAKNIYETVKAYAALTGEEEVWDLYCGTGTIGLILSKGAKHVTGIEEVSAAIADAENNAAKNGVKNIEFIQGDAGVIYCEHTKVGSEVVVVDPPRKGCDKSLIETMLKNRPEKIIYVSCDSATFARDVRLLSEGGYRLKKWKFIDQFPQTVHTESVGLLEI